MICIKCLGTYIDYISIFLYILNCVTIERNDENTNFNITNKN